MVWLGLALLLVAFQRGWVVAPMVLFALPLVLPALAVSLPYGFDFSYVVPDAIEGHATQAISLVGLLVLALTQRRR